MQRIVLHILLFATLLPSISPWGTIMYYNVNKEYIARVLCENRDRPQLHCDGKCYLAKKLKSQQDKQDKETTRLVRNTPTITLFCTERFSFRFSGLVLASLVNTVPNYLFKPYTAPQAALFQPPRA